MANRRRNSGNSKPRGSNRAASLDEGKRLRLQAGQVATQKRVCRNCGAREVYVIESRPFQHKLIKETGRRRRLECASCHHRTSTVEISGELFAHLMYLKEVMEKIRLSFTRLDVSLSLAPQEPKGDFGGKCQECIHCSASNECTFGIPEFNTEEASDCNLYACANQAEKAHV